jgi:hypothetical protein
MPTCHPEEGISPTRLRSFTRYAGLGPQAKPPDEREGHGFSRADRRPDYPRASAQVPGERCPDRRHVCAQQRKARQNV